MVKPVDLLSSIGGNLGLWLGLSALSLGKYLLQSVKTLAELKIF